MLHSFGLVPHRSKKLRKLSHQICLSAVCSRAHGSFRLSPVRWSRPPDITYGETQHSCHTVKTFPLDLRGLSPSGFHLLRHGFVYYVAPTVPSFSGMPTGLEAFLWPPAVCVSVLRPVPPKRPRTILLGTWDNRKITTPDLRIDKCWTSTRQGQKKYLAFRKKSETCLLLSKCGTIYIHIIIIIMTCG